MKLYEIALCDDEALSLELLRVNLNYLLKKHGTRAMIDTYPSGKELLNSDKKYDLLFLDIEMPGLNGLKTAEQYRKLYEDAIIVFLTGYDEYVLCERIQQAGSCIGQW